MEIFYYLSLTPEAFIASMLSPKEFGKYQAVGTKKRTHGEAMFFQIDPSFKSDHFPLKNIEERCKPHADGSPKRSLYLSVYRVIEHIPAEALLDLYLVTDDGRVLQLSKTEYSGHDDGGLHLYQELAPVMPQIASKHDPLSFCRFVTDRTHPISVPRLVFVELILGNLANDPANGKADNLPYANMDHLRDCLISLRRDDSKFTKTVVRCMHRDILYRTIKNGFFVGDQKSVSYYPFPSINELEEKYHEWWRSALTIGF